jgi:hypothetical protein
MVWLPSTAPVPLSTIWKNSGTCRTRSVVPVPSTVTRMFTTGSPINLPVNDGSGTSRLVCPSVAEAPTTPPAVGSPGVVTTPLAFSEVIVTARGTG